ncbi:MAG TPA: YbaK/EbsC family protein [Holophagaceae bacterium]|nr:YbaK/EbsC family protein [Holophagaceae bacterium]
MGIAATIDRYLDEVHVPYDVVDHRPTLSSAETARVAHVEGQKVAKGVVLRNKKDGRCVLAVIPATHRLQLRWLRDDFDLDLELLPEQELRSLFPDCLPGAVPPLGQAYHLMTVWDERLDRQSELYFEAGDHEHLVHLRHDDFHRLFEGVPHGILSSKES